MGRHLFDSLGGADVAVGFTFGEGTYSACGPHNPYRVHESYAGTHEHVLRMLEVPTFLLELAKLPSAHPLRDVAGFRYMGSRPQETTQFFPPRAQVLRASRQSGRDGRKHAGADRWHSCCIRSGAS